MQNGKFDLPQWAFVILFAITAISASTFYTSCTQEAPEAHSNELSPNNKSVEYYLNAVETCKQTGNIAYFREANGNIVENPDETWVNNFVAQQQVASRSSVESNDIITFEIRPVQGATFNRIELNVGTCFSIVNPNCLTTGDVYFGTGFLCPQKVLCHDISCVIESGEGKCSNPGKCEVRLWRIGENDCFCPMFFKTAPFPTPESPYQLGSYCCSPQQRDCY